MTGAEQATVNELAGLTRVLRDDMSDFRSEMRAELAAVRTDVRALQDDKVARDAIAADRAGTSIRASRRTWAMLTFGAGVVGIVANIASRLVLGS